MEVWLHSFSWAHRVAPAAAAAERMGFDGFLLADSQNLNADIWVELALAGAATGRIALGPGVTNTETRDPAVTASAIATLHAETGGRAVLGLGRGDSALSQLGRAPVGLERFEVGLKQIQAYLRGAQVERDGVASGIRWLPDLPVEKVPVMVAASGPRVIRLAARHADRIDLTVGAEPERVRWAVATARAVNPDVSIGAFVNVAVHQDRAIARDLVRGNTAMLARFSAAGAPPDGLSSTTRAGVAHLTADGDRVDDEFVDRFAVAGTVDEVTERLAALGSEGLDRVIVVPGSLDADPDLVKASNDEVASSVLPVLHGRG